MIRENLVLEDELINTGDVGLHCLPQRTTEQMLVLSSHSLSQVQFILQYLDTSV